MTYSNEWHEEAYKRDGGWALECINPLQPCVQSGNWNSSNALQGGTPGKQNSIIDTASRDTEAPQISRVLYYQEAGMFVLQFNESLFQTDSIQVEHTPGSIEVAYTLGNEIQLIHQPDAPESFEFNLSVSGIKDCVLNESGRIDITLGIPTDPVPGDLLINEILFDPAPGGIPYIEIANVSSGWHTTDQFYLSVMNSGVIKPGHSISPILFGPEAIVALTKVPAQTALDYPYGRSEGILEYDLPSFPADSGHVSLVSRSGAILESCSYDVSWHSPFLVNAEGVSLERIRLDKPGTVAGNWQSAAGTSGYGTPGTTNSQVHLLNDTISFFTLSGNILSPDGDGFEDFLQIELGDEVHGGVIRAAIFGIQGEVVKSLAEGGLVGSGATLKWDGSGSDSSRAQPGVYVLAVEVLTPDGERLMGKAPIVLATRL